MEKSAYYLFLADPFLWLLLQLFFKKWLITLCLLSSCSRKSYQRWVISPGQFSSHLQTEIPCENGLFCFNLTSAKLLWQPRIHCPLPSSKWVLDTPHYPTLCAPLWQEYNSIDKHVNFPMFKVMSTPKIQQETKINRFGLFQMEDICDDILIYTWQP